MVDGRCRERRAREKKAQRVEVAVGMREMEEVREP